MRNIRKKLPNLFWVLAIAIPVVLVFKRIFFGQLPTWGDAPYFYPETLEDFYAKFSVWTYRGQILGGVDNLLWLYPLMYLLGFLHHFLHLDSNTLIRLVFYAPSVVLAGVGPYFLARYLKFSAAVGFFSALFYILNTYFILLVDGGQVGVALAYGVFPFVVYAGKRALDRITWRSFFVFESVLFLETLIDPRITIVVFLLILFWQCLENVRKIWLLIIAGILLVPLNSFWLIPLLKTGAAGLSLDVVGLDLSSLLNALFLYAPHWPGNIYGKVIPPPFYYCLVPVLIFGSFALNKKDRKIQTLLLLFLVFAFISKGSTPPLGGWYEFITTLPFGFIFRDSSKFFIPLTLLGGILIGHTVSALKGRVSYVACYGFLLFLVWPALVGKLNFNLSNRTVGEDFQIIYEKVKTQSEFFRTLWVPERHPLAFESGLHPTGDGRSLIDLKPIESLNASEDAFNFLNNSAYVKWLEVFGFKYLMLSGDPRNPKPDPEDIKNWREIVNLAQKTPGLTKVDWQTAFPVYEIPNPFPKRYFVDSIIAVIGPFVDSTQTAIYFEDGKLDPLKLENLNPDSMKVFFNGKDESDLTMSFLQQFFVSPSENIYSDWAVFETGKRLKTKYELLIRGFDYQDFDFQKGIALSTQKDEVLRFRFNVPAGNYIIATRQANLNNQSFYWRFEEKWLEKGVFEYEIKNTSGFEVFNTLALIPKEKWGAAKKTSQKLLQKYQVINRSEIKDLSSERLNLTQGRWEILNESYHPIWKSVPVYSTINGIYHDR